VDFGLHLTAGDTFSVSTDPGQIWHGALPGDPYYNFLSSNADGAAGLAWFSPH
jgi:hypothetical protein